MLRVAKMRYENNRQASPASLSRSLERRSIQGGSIHNRAELGKEGRSVCFRVQVRRFIVE